VSEWCCALASQTGGPPQADGLEFLAPPFVSRQKVERQVRKETLQLKPLHQTNHHQKYLNTKENRSGS
jgi:hypothetical protein